MIDCFKLVALMKPSFSVQITHLVLDLYDFGTRQSKQIMKIIHSFLSLVHLRIVYGDEDSDLSSEYNDYSEHCRIIRSTTTKIPEGISNILPYTDRDSHVSCSCYCCGLERAKTRISTLTCFCVINRGLGRHHNDTLSPWLDISHFSGPALKSLSLIFNDLESIRS